MPHLESIFTYPSWIFLVTQYIVTLHHFKQFPNKITQIFHRLFRSTPTVEQICENPSNPSISSHRLPHWITQPFSEGEPIIVNEHIQIPSHNFLSEPETLSLSSTPSATGQTPTTTIPTIFPNPLELPFSTECICAIPRISKIDLESIGIYSKSDIQHQI